MKWGLEDLSFRYLEPEKYYDLVDQMETKLKLIEDIVNDTMNPTHTKGFRPEAHIKADIKGRPKHFWVFTRDEKDNRDLSPIYDLLAVRVIVDTIPDCYAVLVLLIACGNHCHIVSKIIPCRNQYVSILTSTVIRTMGATCLVNSYLGMHRVSEYGVTAHWRYSRKVIKTAIKFDKSCLVSPVLEWQDTEAIQRSSLMLWN